MTQTPRTVRSGTATAGYTDAAYPVLRQMRVELVTALRQFIQARGWSDARAAAELHVGHLRISAINAGRADRFTLDLLIALAERAGLSPRVVLSDPAAVVALRRPAKA